VRKRNWKSLDKISRISNPFEIRNSDLKTILEKLKEANHIYNKSFLQRNRSVSNENLLKDVDLQKKRDYENINEFISEVINKPSIANNIILADIGYDPRQNTRILELLFEKFLEAKALIKSEPQEDRIKTLKIPHNKSMETEINLNNSMRKAK